MQINETNPFPKQAVTNQSVQGFMTSSVTSMGPTLPKFDEQAAILQIATSQLTNNHLMHKELALQKQLAEYLILLTKMIKPYRTIHQNDYSVTALWRRGNSPSHGTEPPSNAKRSAVLLSIFSFKTSHINAVFFCTPVKSTACACRSSPMFNIVRFIKLLSHQCRHLRMPMLMPFATNEHVVYILPVPCKVVES